MVKTSRIPPKPVSHASSYTEHSKLDAMKCLAAMPPWGDSAVLKPGKIQLGALSQDDLQAAYFDFPLARYLGRLLD